MAVTVILITVNTVSTLMNYKPPTTSSSIWPSLVDKVKEYPEGRSWQWGDAAVRRARRAGMAERGRRGTKMRLLFCVMLISCADVEINPGQGSME